MFTTSLKGNHMDITPAIRSYTEDKVRMLEKFTNSDEQIFVEVELGKTTEHHQKGDVFRAEITMRTPHGSYRAAEEKDNLYAAIDIAKDELADELKKNKEKQTSRVKRGGRMIKDLMRKIGFGE